MDVGGWSGSRHNTEPDPVDGDLNGVGKLRWKADGDGGRGGRIGTDRGARGTRCQSSGWSDLHGRSGAGERSHERSPPGHRWTRQEERLARPCEAHEEAEERFVQRLHEAAGQDLPGAGKGPRQAPQATHRSAARRRTRGRSGRADL
eukprot:scaffold772_cov339-Pavlova_lutheri.AAC.17